MRLLVLAALPWALRRLRPVSVAFAVYEAWRRLPPEQRERMIEATRRNAPRVASRIARRGRTRA